MTSQRLYKFTVICDSGERKTIEFYASNFSEAKKFIEEYSRNN